jgi:CBS domain-containing protein
VERPLEPQLRTTVDMTPSETPVRSVMSPGIIVLSGEATVAACAAAMSERRTHAVLIIDPGTREPLGWVKHKDVLHHLRRDPYTTRAADVVSAEATWIHPEETVEAAAERMVADDISHILVGHGTGTLPEGVLSSWDLVAFYAGR